MDRQLRGVPASPGIASGPVHLLHWEVPDVRIRRIPDEAIPEELARFRKSVERAKERLRAVRKRVETTTGPEEAAIFEVQLSILGDRELVNVVEERIKDGVGAETAFDHVMLDWRRRFARHEHPMLRERVGDLPVQQVHRSGRDAR